jgi:hydrogenase expression/formation protein HypD
MKYLDEYRDQKVAQRLVDEIKRTVTRPCVLMEVCGGQTHSIVRYGLDNLLPEKVELVHGPGCPVCVTSLEMIDRAHAIARRPDVIFCSFGDMLRVPGSNADLFRIKSEGGNVRVVYSPLDCLKIARANPDKNVVFFAIGFETTAPANAMVVWQAREQGIRNFSVLVSHVLVPPAMRGILDSPNNRVQGFLGPGHVCAISGWTEYEPIVEQYRVPIVITGFEPIDILQGILMCVRQLERGRAELENAYVRAVQREGNVSARHMIDRIFRVRDRAWRGLGVIPQSGFGLSEEFSEFDAEQLFDVRNIYATEPAVCMSGSILQGLKKPLDCPAFGKECTPETPLGATMVSAEGACAAYYNHGRHLVGIEMPALKG